MGNPSKLMNRNFFLLWQGQSISQLGAQAFAVAMLFWIKHATDSATVMGLLQMVSSLPAVLLGPIGGAFADRHSRRKIIIFSDALSGISVLSLAGLMFVAADATDTILVWLFLVSVFTAITRAFFNPAISAAIPDLVPKDRVTSANSLGQLSYQISMFIGQGLGGTIFRLLGAPALFLINGLTYLFSAASESFITIPQATLERSGGWKDQFREFGRDVLDSLRYVWARAGLRGLVLVSAFLSFFRVPVIVLLPFYVEDFLQATTDWYGFLLATYGIGSLAGYLFAGSMKISGKARGALMMGFIVLESAGYGLLGLVSRPAVALLFAFLGGVAGGFVTINITTLVQITTPCEIRGRVFGLLGTISGSLAPVAMGLAGVLADLMDQNIPLLYGVCGGVMALLSTWIATDQDYRTFLAYEQAEETSQKLNTPYLSKGHSDGTPAMSLDQGTR